MKKNLIWVITLVLFLIPIFIIGQTPPPLGSVSSFVLFTSVGAVTNLGSSQISGNMGTNSGAVSGFGNVNGQIHIANATTTQCAIDLGIAYTNLSGQIPGATLGLVLGSGQALLPNVYLVPGASSLVGNLILDGCGDPNACFVFQMNGAFSTAVGSSIILTNGTKACNVFWRVNGQMGIATNTSFKGTLIVAGAIPFDVGVNLEGRALAVSGAISVSALTAITPIGCGEPILTGPAAPNLGYIGCFSILTSSGTVTNMGTTDVVGDIGINSGTVSGFNPLGVSGLIHSIPDVTTAQASSDLSTIYTYLNGLPADIELLYPVLFGYRQVLTPHVYVMNAATVLTDTVFLDARGVAGAVFVIRIMGALTTGPSPQVILLGGAQANNVFWQVEGAVTISSGANFNGIIVAHNSAIILNTGIALYGRALSTNGNITTQNVNSIGTNTVGVASSSTPTICINTALTSITHTTTGATGVGTATGLPAGVTAIWVANTITISGTPTISGTFNYSVPLTGGCGTANAIGTIIVNTGTTTSNTAGAASSNPTLCISAALTNITHVTTGATGIGLATGLPSGVIATWSTNTITISGRPTSSGLFNYTVPLTGGCGSVNGTGVITVTPVATNTASTASSTPTLCINTTFSYIAHTTIGTTGIGPATGLPTGVTAAWVANTIIISGIPSESGTFYYSIPLTGGCGCVRATGIIIITTTVGPTVTLTTASDTICHGVKVKLSGDVTATGAWTLTLSNGQTTTGSGNGVWNIVVEPTTTTLYTITNIIDGSACQGSNSGTTTIALPLAGTIISNDNESSTCPVTQNGWVHYYHSSGRLIASINSAGQNLGNVSVTSYIDATVQTIPACGGPNLQYATAVMQRHWVITPSIQPTLPIQVRLPFTNLELTNLSSVANSNANTDDDVNTIADIKLSKYSGTTNVDNDATNNCTSGVTTIHTQVSTGITTAYSAVTGSQYTDFSIPGFSEFWLHGSKLNSPLPIELLSFTAIATNKEVAIEWKTATETNSYYFNIERSADAINFATIGTINGAGNSLQTLSYSIIDYTPLEGISYYRLKQTDYDGKTSYSNIEAVEFKNSNSFIFNVYPNPNNGEEIKLQILTNNDAEVLVVVFDVLGKEIYSKVIITKQNDKDVYAIDPTQKINPGVYMIIATSNNEIYNKRLIIK